jgi:hypothetical protein
MAAFIEVPTTEGVKFVNIDAIALFEKDEGPGTRLTLRLNNGVSNSTGGYPRVIYSTAPYDEILAAIKRVS